MNGKRAMLIDLSGGRGKETAPIKVMTWTGISVGYAGGIGPDNVGKILSSLLSYDEQGSFWLDMETKVRTDDWLDLDKVELVLNICDKLINEKEGKEYEER